MQCIEYNDFKEIESLLNYHNNLELLPQNVIKY